MLNRSQNMSNKDLLRGFSGKSIVVILLVLVTITASHARKIYSSGSGNWTTTGTWVGGIVPVANDTVIIQNTHSVAVTANLYSNSTYMFLIILGTLDLTNNGKMSFSSTSKIIIETGARILGNNSADQISIGTGGAEYTGSQGTITGPSYVSNGHSPTSGEGTAGCGCYSSVGSCTITSTNGYKVHINVWATQILVETSPCTWGYNYDVRLNYNISFSGTNIPASLSTLQGTVFCGSSALFFDLPNSGGSGTVDTGGNAWRNISDCNTATPQSLNCLNATIQIDGPGISSGTTCTSALPIELLSFEVKPITQGADVSWTTSMEKNVDFFEVERASTDLNFVAIGRLESKGGLDINTSYNFVDKYLNQGKNYYRLKSVDHDGSFEYSKALYLFWNQASTIKLYPNPVKDHRFTIEINDDLESATQISVVDQLGHVIYKTVLTQTKADITLPSSVQPGIYWITFVPSRQQALKMVIH